MPDHPFDFTKDDPEPLIRLPRRRRNLSGPSLAVPLCGIFALLASVAAGAAIWLGHESLPGLSKMGSGTSDPEQLFIEIFDALQTRFSKAGDLAIRKKYAEANGEFAILVGQMNALEDFVNDHPDLSDRHRKLRTVRELREDIGKVRKIMNVKWGLERGTLRSDEAIRQLKEE